MTSTHDSGVKSGQVFGGVLRIYTADKSDYVDITYASGSVKAGIVTFTNKAGGTNHIDLV